VLPSSAILADLSVARQAPCRPASASVRIRQLVDHGSALRASATFSLASTAIYLPKELIDQADGHRGRHAKRFVNAHPIVMQARRCAWRPVRWWPACQANWQKIKDRVNPIVRRGGGDLK